MPEESTTQRIAELEAEIAALPPDSIEARARLVEMHSELGALRGEPVENPAWLRVKLARHVKRPHSLDYIHRLAPDFTEIHGDRCFGDDSAIVSGFGNLRGRPVMFVGQQKGHDTKQKLLRNFGMPKPEGYRKAMRAMELAAKFNRPIITLLDTPGAYPGIDAEERGQAEAIAWNLREMARLTTPIIVVVIGEGGSGGALALGIGNRVYMLENSVYSVISPESIIYRDASKGALAAAALRLTAPDLSRFGLIDGIVPEPIGGAQEDPAQAAEYLLQTLLPALDELSELSPEQLVEIATRAFGGWATSLANSAAGSCTDPETSRSSALQSWSSVAVRWARRNPATPRFLLRRKSSAHAGTSDPAS